MEPDRQEVYERIPWETLDTKRNDRQWLVYAIAGAVVLGALAYSFMRNQPTAAPLADGAATTMLPAPVTTITGPDTTPTTITTPVVVAEADLYAVDPELLAEQAASHAEWFAVEYLAFDGTETSRELIRELLPEGVPVPEASEGTQVFVDWARAVGSTQTGPTTYRVDVLVRSLVSDDESGFTRQPARLLEIGVSIGEDGRARVVAPPSVGDVEVADRADSSLVPVPEELVASIEAEHGPIVGGLQRGDGTWQVVVMAEGPDGVRRPVTVAP